jgi:hypothetical protein
VPKHQKADDAITRMLQHYYQINGECEALARLRFREICLKPANHR